VSSGPIDLKSISKLEDADEIFKAFDELDASQMNQAEAERVKRTFGSLGSLFGMGGEEQTHNQEEEGGKDKTLKTIAAVLVAIKLIIKKLAVIALIAKKKGGEEEVIEETLGDYGDYSDSLF